MCLDLETIGYYLFMEEQEKKEPDPEYNYFRFNDEDIEELQE